MSGAATSFYRSGGESSLSLSPLPPPSDNYCARDGYKLPRVFLMRLIKFPRGSLCTCAPTVTGQRFFRFKSSPQSGGQGGRGPDPLAESTAFPSHVIFRTEGRFLEEEISRDSVFFFITEVLAYALIFKMK